MLGRKNNFPESHEIKNVPFISQSSGQCGPATLAMVMNWTGLNVSPEELSTSVMTPAFKGSLQQDMITAAQRKGLIAAPIQGLDALLNEITADHPVIIFENL
ncbi:MAG: cysteine peptidase family C39 domain-containing protein, partial [Bdellovibrio sp.]